MSTNWSPQVARAMHELSNVAPAPPSANDLDQHQPPAPRGTPLWAPVAAAVIVIAAVIGLYALARRDDPATIDGPATTIAEPAATIDVRHNTYEVTITGDVVCDHPIDSTGHFSTYSVDTWSDRAGRQWRTTITYPDGSTVDRIAQGSAVYPTGAFERGQLRAAQLGCMQSSETYVLSIDALFDGVFALDIGPELIDERAYVQLFSDQGTQVSGDHVDSRGRQSQLWEERIDGFGGFGTAADRPLLQVQRWWVDPTDGTTVTERQFVNTVEGLGTATMTGTLVSTEAAAVPADVFDTTGYRALETFPRPDLPPTTGETMPGVIPPTTTAALGDVLPTGSVLRFQEPLTNVGDGATVSVYDTPDDGRVCTFVQSSASSGGGCDDRTNIEEGRSYGFLGGQQGTGLLFGLAPLDIDFTATVGDLTLFPDEHGVWYTLVPAGVTEFTMSSTKSQQIIPLMTPGTTAPGTTVAIAQSP
jgi:hypothetical protein